MALKAVIPPDEKLSKRILDDIHTTQEQLERDVETLKGWLKLQPHLPQNVLGDTHIASFIIGCKNSLEKAKVRIDTYFTNRSDFPEVYGNRDLKSEEFLADEETTHVFLVPSLTPEGYSVGLTRFVDPDSDAITCATFLKRSMVMLDLTLMTRYQGGYYGLVDLKGMNMKLLAKVSLPLITKFLCCLQDGMPLRIKAIFAFNVPSIAEHVLSVLLMMTKESLRKKIHIYSNDHTVLYKYIPKEMLPKEYGGEAGTCEDIQQCLLFHADASLSNIDRLMQVRCFDSPYQGLQESISRTAMSQGQVHGYVVRSISAFYKFNEGFRPWFQADGKIAVDETKRPQKSVYKSKQLYGVEGSFKKLNID